jgi:hypothetical protein
MSDRTSLIKEIASHITYLKSQFRRLDTEFALQKNLRSDLEARKRAALKSLVDALLILKVVDTNTLSNHVGFASLPAEVERIDARFANWQSQIVEIEADADYQNALDLIDPTTGNLILEKTQQEGYLKDLKDQLAKYDNNSSFKKYLEINKNGGINPTKKWWIRLWQIITGQQYVYNRLKKQVLKLYECVDSKSLFDKHGEINQNIAHYQDSLNQLNLRISNVTSKQSRLAKLTADYAKRESTKMVEVYEKVLSHLSSVQDFSQIRTNLGSVYSILTGTVIALGQQISLMSTSIDGLRIEIADREKMINQLSTLSFKLKQSRKPLVKSDVSAQLNSAVQNRQIRTDLYITKSNGYATRVYSYDSYDTFDHRLSSIDDELNNLNLLAYLIQIESQDNQDIDLLSQDSNNMFGDIESTSYDPTSLEIPIVDLYSPDLNVDIQSIIDEMPAEPSHSNHSSGFSHDHTISSHQAQDAIQNYDYAQQDTTSITVDTSPSYE